MVRSAARQNCHVGSNFIDHTSWLHDPSTKSPQTLALSLQQRSTSSVAEEMAETSKNKTVADAANIQGLRRDAGAGHRRSTKAACRERLLLLGMSPPPAPLVVP